MRETLKCCHSVKPSLHKRDQLALRGNIAPGMHVAAGALDVVELLFLCALFLAFSVVSTFCGSIVSVFDVLRCRIMQRRYSVIVGKEMHMTSFYTGAGTRKNQVPSERLQYRVKWHEQSLTDLFFHSG